MIDWDLVEAIFILAAIVGFLVLSYFVSNNKLKPPFKQIAEPLVPGVSFVIFLLIAGCTKPPPKTDGSGMTVKVLAAC